MSTKFEHFVKEVESRLTPEERVTLGMARTFFKGVAKDLQPDPEPESKTRTNEQWAMDEADLRHRQLAEARLLLAEESEARLDAEHERDEQARRAREAEGEVARLNRIIVRQLGLNLADLSED